MGLQVQLRPLLYLLRPDHGHPHGAEEIGGVRGRSCIEPCMLGRGVGGPATQGLGQTESIACASVCSVFLARRVFTENILSLLIIFRLNIISSYRFSGPFKPTRRSGRHPQPPAGTAGGQTRGFAPRTAGRRGSWSCTSRCS